MKRRVSVVVPVHNGAAFVDHCWRSIDGQTAPPAEILFIDDGSTDDTRRLLTRLPTSRIAVRVLEKARSGPADSRNTGIRAALSPFIAFLDIDDGWPTQKLQQSLAAFDENAALDAVGGLVELCNIDHAGRRNALGPPQHRVNLGAFVYRREIFARVGLLDPSLTFAEDVDFMCRLRQAGAQIRELNEVTLYYRRHPGNMTRGQDVRGLGLFTALAKSLSRTRRSDGAG